MKNVAIKIEKVNKEYNTHNETIKVFQDYSYEFEYGKMYGIVGRSGCGKSTLIKMIALIENYDSGNIFINNISTKDMNDLELSKVRNNNIGLIFQDYMLDENLNVYDNILLPTLINGNENNKDNIEKLSKRYGIDKRLKHYPKELSGGEQQRVSIARALVNNPNIILADEPTGNLDKKNEKLIFDDLKNLSKEGKCVIVITHADIIKNYVDKIIDLEGDK